MKQDLSISDLFSKVQQLAKLKRDYLVPTKDLSVSCNQNGTSLNVNGTQYSMQPRAAAQLSGIVRMPFSYYQRLEKNYPDLLNTNLNTLLAQDNKTRLIRTLGGKARAVLSDRYKRIEHEQLLNTIMPLINDINGMEIVSSSITDERLYLKAICTYERAEVKVGDAVAFGILCTNSEVGCSSVIIQPYVEVLKCTNGMVLPHYYESTRRIHLGKKMYDVEVDAPLNYPGDDFSKVIEGEIRSILDSQFYMSVVEKMKEATEIYVQDIVSTLDKIVKIYTLDDKERELIYLNFLAEKDTSLWGLVNAITEASKASATYERAHKLESIGTSVLYDCLADYKKHPSSNDFYLVA